MQWKWTYKAGLLLLMGFLTFSAFAQSSKSSPFQKIPKHPPIKIPKLPESPPAMQRLVECNDPDGGDALTKGSATKKNTVLKDRCVSGEKPAETFLERIKQLWRRYARRTLGLHD